MEIAVYLAAFGTLRRSEVCALTSDDVRDNMISIYTLSYSIFNMNLSP